MSGSKMSDNDFMKNFSLMIGALIVLTVVIYVLAQNVAGDKSKTKTAKVSTEDKALIARIEPVGKLVLAGAVGSTVSSAQAADGASTYNAACVACHGSGAAGAPKTGDKAAWKARIAKGMPALYEVGIKGKPGTAMLPKGGNATLSDAAVKAAVDYMVGKSK
jgi:cytochrome c5